jgi:hypothetical protein
LIENVRITNTSTNVPMISLTRFQVVLRMAGPVLKTASLRSASSVAAQCG